MERTRIPDREASIAIVEEEDSSLFSTAEEVWQDRGFECVETIVSSVELLGDPVVIVRYLLETDSDVDGEYVVVLEDESVRRRMLEFTQDEEIELFIIDADGLNKVV